MLMRLVYTGGKGIYRHDAEGSDDMPVCGCGGLKRPMRVYWLTQKERHILSPHS